MAVFDLPDQFRVGSPLSYEFYKVIHLTGIIIAFVSIGMYLGASLSGTPGPFKGKKFAGLTHGIGLLLALLGGFGLMARLQIFSSWPTWITVKLIIWLLLGGIIAVIVRKPKHAKLLWAVVIALGVLAAIMARYKFTF